MLFLTRINAASGTSSPGTSGQVFSIRGGFGVKPSTRQISKPGRGADLDEDHADVFIALEDNAFRPEGRNRGCLPRQRSPPPGMLVNGCSTVATGSVGDLIRP